MSLMILFSLEKDLFMGKTSGHYSSNSLLYLFTIEILHGIDYLLKETVFKVNPFSAGVYVWGGGL